MTMRTRKTKRIPSLRRAADYPARAPEPVLVQVGYPDRQDQAHDPAVCRVRLVEGDSRPQAAQQGVGAKKMKPGAALDGRPVVHPSAVVGVAMTKKMIIRHHEVADFPVRAPVEPSLEDQQVHRVAQDYLHVLVVCQDHL